MTTVKRRYSPPSGCGRGQSGTTAAGSQLQLSERRRLWRERKPGQAKRERKRERKGQGRRQRGGWVGGVGESLSFTGLHLGKKEMSRNSELAYSHNLLVSLGVSGARSTSSGVLERGSIVL